MKFLFSERSIKARNEIAIKGERSNFNLWAACAIRGGGFRSRNALLVNWSLIVTLDGTLSPLSACHAVGKYLQEKRATGTKRTTIDKNEIIDFFHVS